MAEVHLPVDAVVSASKACSRETQWDTSAYDALIARGWNVNQHLGHIGDALILAVGANKLPLVQYLLQHGANPNANVRGETSSSLECAITANASPEIVSLLLDHGAAVSNRSTALLAASGGHFDLLKRLISSGAGIDSIPDNEYVYDNAREQDDWGTPLHGAAGNSQVECVLWLLTAGTDRNVRNYRGLTPRDVAEKRGHIHCVELVNKL
ncbi:ankyrin [Hypoxylon trugodes]|uniref:ankyrin n=1 Tax=Hypoxylon trugodes TaxID=326681 RepID=UPI00218F7EB9|nr:ankyrin [Hypoxylon trugodes]KAI1383871.1 ankyrin [Hypoxylon trugodes]